MELVRGLHNVTPDHQGCVATIGNFDGVHLGHQSVFRHLLNVARHLDLPATVITFEPQPQEFIAPRTAPARLTRLREKVQALEAVGIDRVVLLRFGHQLAQMPARVFVHRLLIDELGVRHLIVGDDFQFGKGREGNIAMLREIGRKYGFPVENMDTFMLYQDRVSSTRIRAALLEGNLDTAQEYLGRPYRIFGRVAHGDERGRAIGFPTANVDLHRAVSPVRGVFAVRMYGLGPQAFPGVANIGNRPTVDGGARCLLEVHLFDFDRQIYGEHVEVEFVRRLRDEQRFESLKELKHQIAHDTAEARALLT